MYLGRQKSGSLLNIYYSNCHAEWGQSSCVTLSLLHELMQPVITTQHCKYWDTKHSIVFIGNTCKCKKKSLLSFTENREILIIITCIL